MPPATTAALSADVSSTRSAGLSGGLRRGPAVNPFVQAAGLRPPPADQRNVKANAFWSLPLEALDLAANIPPQTEVVFALQQRGIGMIECLGTLQDAPSLSSSSSATLDAAVCLAQPFLLEEDNGELAREAAAETQEETQSAVALRYAKEVAAARNERRRTEARRGQLTRMNSLDDTDMHALGLFEMKQPRKLADFTSPSTKLMIATLHSLNLERSRNIIRLSSVKEIEPPLQTLDMSEPDHGYLLNSTDTMAGSLAGSLAGTLAGSVDL